jgi:hypothetical protein
MDKLIKVFIVFVRENHGKEPLYLESILQYLKCTKSCLYNHRLKENPNILTDKYLLKLSEIINHKYSFSKYYSGKVSGRNIEPIYAYDIKKYTF